MTLKMNEKKRTQLMVLSRDLHGIMTRLDSLISPSEDEVLEGFSWDIFRIISAIDKADDIFVGH